MSIRVVPATPCEQFWAAEQVTVHHYLHSAPDVRSRPFCCVVRLGEHGGCHGCLWFGRPESTRCFVGGLTYGGADDVAAGRAEFDRWEVLNLARVWFSPDVQFGGRLCEEGRVPGFRDRKGAWRSTLASGAIRLVLARVGRDYLLAFPPVWVGQPYRIRAVMSYCDTKLHRGLIYQAAGFELARVNDDGIQTWFTRAVADLTADEDAKVRGASKSSPKARALRWRKVSLFDEEGGEG